MKRLKGAILTILLATTLSSITVFAGTGINLIANGETVQFTDSAPYVDNNGRIMIPVAKVGEIFGVQVVWDVATQTVTVKGKGKDVALQLGSDVIVINGEKSTMDSKPVSKNGRTYVPVSAIAKALGVSASWDSKTSTVSLKEPGYVIPTPEGNDTVAPVIIETKIKDTTESGIDFSLILSEKADVYLLYQQKSRFEDLTAEEIVKSFEGKILNTQKQYLVGDVYGRIMPSDLIKEWKAQDPAYSLPFGYNKTTTMTTTTNSKTVLLPNTEYVLSVVVRDKAGNLSNIECIEFKTKEDAKPEITEFVLSGTPTKEMVKFNYKMDQLAQSYVLVSTKDYANNNVLTANEIINLFKTTTLDNNKTFETADMSGNTVQRAISGSYSGMLISKFPSDTECVIRLVVVDESGKSSDVNTLGFTTVK